MKIELPEWYDDAVRLAWSGRRFYHVSGCWLEEDMSDVACTCGAASANAVLDRMALAGRKTEEAVLLTENEIASTPRGLL